MTIALSCPKCGTQLEAPDDYAGMDVSCPSCETVFTVPAEQKAPEPAPAPQTRIAPPPSMGTPASDSAIAPPPGADVNFIIALPEKFQSPGYPDCWLDMSSEGAVIDADFKVDPVLEAFALAFAKRLKKKYNVQLGRPADGEIPCAQVRVVSIVAGNRFLRYFLTFIAGKTCFEITGVVRGTAGKASEFTYRHKTGVGVFGGNSLSLLKMDAAITANRVAKLVIKNMK